MTNHLKWRVKEEGTPPRAEFSKSSLIFYPSQLLLQGEAWDVISAVTAPSVLLKAKEPTRGPRSYLSPLTLHHYIFF
jgi:hypothetical protein